MRNLLDSSMVSRERRRVKHLIKQEKIVAIQHSLYSSYPCLFPSIFNVILLWVTRRSMVLYTSQITNSLNYSLFALQLGGFVVGFVCSSPPPPFLPCKLASYQPAVKIASGIHQMRVFNLQSSWSPACTKPISNRQALFSQMVSSSLKI